MRGKWALPPERSEIWWSSISRSERWETKKALRRPGPLTVGIQLCYETHFPEISTVMALKGVEVLFLPHASPRGEPAEKMESWLRHLPSRAFDNGVFVIACNQAGTNKEGLSFPAVALALGPDGRIMESHTGKDEGLMLVDLKADFLDGVRNHRMRYFLSRRRPELYTEISSSVFRR